MNRSRFPAAVAVLAAVAFMALAATMAAADDWFIPGQQAPQHNPSSPAPHSAHPGTRPEHARPAATPAQASSPAPGDPAQPAPQAALPPIPQLPALPRGASPPAAVIGVFDGLEVMRASTAAQQAGKILRARHEKLEQDRRKEEAALRDMQLALANDRPKLTQDQIGARERELHERITNAQRQFGEREKIIQDAAQYAQAQIARPLAAIIRQVAESRGMNLVLHRAQVALNVNEFDITQEVTDQLNKLVATVSIPPDGQEPPIAAAAPPAAAPTPTAAAANVPPAPAMVNTGVPGEQPPPAGTAEAAAPPAAASGPAPARK